MGGLDAFYKLKTLKFTGIFTTQGTELPITIQTINGRATRSDLELNGQAIITSYKDGKAWTINPFTGATTATDVEGVQLSDLKQQSMVANQLMDYKARGHQVVLVGQVDVEGVKTFHIKLTNKEDGKVANYYLDASTYLLLKSSNTREMMGQEVEIETFYTDIKDINGLKFSMGRVQKIEGQVFQEVTFSKVEVNIPIDEKIFDKQ
jgi:hypothetical protein